MTGKLILFSFLLLLIGVLAEAAFRSKQAMLQCRAGYGECANKRIEIAEKLRFLPWAILTARASAISAR